MRNSIEFWSDVCLEVVRRDYTKPSKKKPAMPEQDGPTTTSRAMAIVHLAMHDAWFGTTTPAATYLQRVNPPVALPVGAGVISPDSALATAAVVTLLSLYPGQRAYIDRMSTAFIDPSTNAADRDAGHRYGEAIAFLLLNLRKNDGSEVRMAYRPSAAYGRHRPDPFSPNQSSLGAQWGKVKLFCGAGIVPLVAPPGYGLANYLAHPDYLADYTEVKKKGALRSATRTADETAQGLYWGYDGGNEIGVPPRLYNQIARAWLARKFPSNAAKAVKLLAMVNAGMADAGINAWYHKYQYNLWRPVVGIREASPSTGPGAMPGGDASKTATGNEGDPFWAPLGLPKTNEPGPGKLSITPGFPAYPSGHATFGAALFQIMQRFNGNPEMTVKNVLDAGAGAANAAGQEFDFVSDEMNGTAIDAEGSARMRHLRHFDSFARATYENSVSRIFLGVHWRFDGLPRKATDAQYGGVPLGLTVGTQTFVLLN